MPMQEARLLVDAVTERLGSAVEGLDGAVDSALSLAEMLARKALPQRAVSAFVIPSGLTGRTAQSSENAFLQDVDETVAIVLVLRSANDVSGERSLPGLSTLVWSVIFALAGWSPEVEPDEAATGIDPTGVLELRRGRTLQLSAGTVFYQLDFALMQQIRIVA
jgi:hypothetical protein